MTRIILHDLTLRGTLRKDLKRIAKALEEAGVTLIEVDDCDYLDVLAMVLKKAKASLLLAPGSADTSQLRMAHEMGVATIRIATHCADADAARPYLSLARHLGLDAVGFLRMTHLVSPEHLLRQARLLESYGANCVVCADSAGHMVPDDIKRRFALLREHLEPETELGFHGHQNLALAVANSLTAIEHGATRIDAAAGGTGPGAGNTPLEVLVAACERMGIPTGVDLRRIQDVAEDLVVPMLEQNVRLDRDSLTQGFAGLDTSLLPPAKRASAKYNVLARDILAELARQGLTGAHESLVEETALKLARDRFFRTDA